MKEYNEQITVEQIDDSIAYCGLICSLCHLADRCDGCKSENNCCGNHTSAEGCYQYNCCVDKGIEGCWECESAPCEKGMFAPGHDIRLRAFVSFMKEHGRLELAKRVYENMQQGIYYGHGRDYDNLSNEEAVIHRLMTGR